MLGLFKKNEADKKPGFFQRMEDSNMEIKIRDAGGLLAEESKPYFVATVAYSSISAKIQNVSTNPEIVAANPKLLEGYHTVFNTQKKIVDALQRLEKDEEAAVQFVKDDEAR